MDEHGVLVEFQFHKMGSTPQKDDTFVRENPSNIAGRCFGIP